MQPTRINCKNIRDERQSRNNMKVFDAIKTKDLKAFNKNINPQELERVLLDTGLTKDELIDRTSTDDLMNKILSGRLSKKASRQGMSDECFQLEVVNDTSTHFKINIENLTATAFRPKKTGEILSKDDMEQQNISKDECLKSFDGKITGNMNGWIFAKIVYGNGGHQDNVFEEADTLCKWVEDFRKTDTDTYVILIDTDLTKKVEILTQKYKHVNNILVANHYEFQQYIIDNFSPTNDKAKQLV